VDSLKVSHPHGFWLDKFVHWVRSHPEDAGHFLDDLHYQVSDDRLDHSVCELIEHAIHFANIQVRHVLVPRAMMVAVSLNMTLDNILEVVKLSGHSRFPVIEETKDNVLGILFAKELLGIQDPHWILSKHLIRPALFVPESKRLTVLLKEFKEKKQHMALVADEYGGVSGLITLEDIIKELIGHVSDQIDPDVDVIPQQDNTFNVRGMMSIADFNLYFNTHMHTVECDTMGGLLAHHFGYLPDVHEHTTLNGFKFIILQSNKRRIEWFSVSSC
jgi:magnesium and cobalt transporter